MKQIQRNIRQELELLTTFAFFLGQGTGGSQKNSRKEVKHIWLFTVRTEKVPYRSSIDGTMTFGTEVLNSQLDGPKKK